MKWILLFTLLSSVCSGQKVPISKKHPGTAQFKIDLHPAYQKKDIFPLSMVAESLEYIPLETTENNLLGDYLQTVFVTQDGIFVFGYAEGVYRFTREGKYLNKIGRIGRGPGECIKPIGMVLDSVSRSVILLDHDKLVKYDYEGKFIRNYSLSFDANEILMAKDGKLLLNDMFYNYRKPGDRFSIYFFSTETGKTISKFACEKKDKIPFSICHPVMYNYDGRTFIKDYWSDTIYKVTDPSNLETYAVINTGKFIYRNTDDKSVFNGKINPADAWIVDITDISETERFIFMLSNKGLFVFDKVRKETFCCDFEKVDDNNFSLFRNDLTSGPNLKVFLYNSPVNNNTEISYNTAISFFDKNSQKLLTDLPVSLKNLMPSDNQVLVMIKFKNK